jgi:hypothetical protein
MVPVVAIAVKESATLPQSFTEIKTAVEEKT